MSTPAQKHIVAFTVEAWGHARPFINLAARIVKLRPAVTITFLTTNNFYQRAQTELSRSFDEGDEEAASRVRIVSLGEAPKLIVSEEFDAVFASAWTTLVEGRELVCASSAAQIPALPKPSGLILDFFATGPFRHVKAISGDTVKVFAWFAGLTYALFHLFGPESLGGKGNLRLKAEAEAQRTGKTFNEALLQLVEPSGKVIRIPGMLPMYDWEYVPQEFPMANQVAVSLYPRVFETLEAVDGILLFTPDSYEPEATKAVRSWFAEKGRPAYAVGPLLPSASKATATANEAKLSGESTQIQAFLDETVKTSGEKSLVYMSFGSMFWPQTPEKVWAVLDVFIEMNIPFILSHASPFAVIPDEVKEKVKAYGKGILSSWTPQQLILDHPATGWFVAHGGHNGVTEAISAGVPQILWPFGGDQPLNAIHISDQLEIGYELLEVRSGTHGLKPIYRTGYTPKGTIEAVKAEARDILTKAFGEDGAKKRARLEIVRAKVTKEWEEGGKSREDTLTFVDSL